MLKSKEGEQLSVSRPGAVTSGFAAFKRTRFRFYFINTLHMAINTLIR